MGGYAMKYGSYMMIWICALASPARGGESPWFLLARDDGCIELKQLARRENLPKTPATPEEFAQMMRDRGYEVTMGLPEGFPAEMAGKFVQVRVRDNMAPIFVREETCRQVDKQ
jgi:hypothetical protein